MKNNYKSEIERCYFTGDLESFNKHLKDFTGAITRKYFRGFKQSSEAYYDLYTSIMAEIYGYLNGGHYAKTIRNIRLYRILDITDSWSKFGELFNVFFVSPKEKKRFLKSNNFTDEDINDILKRLKISKHIKVKEVDFRSYLQTQIRGELTKYFCRINKERKDVSFDILRKNGYIEEDKNYIHNIEQIIFLYNLNISVDDFISYLKTDKVKNDKNVYAYKLISWCLINRSGVII